MEDPEFWRTVRDPSTGQDIILSREDLQLLERLKQSKVPSAVHDEYEVNLLKLFFFVNSSLNYYDILRKSFFVVIFLIYMYL